METQLARLSTTKTSPKGSILKDFENRADKILIRQIEDTK
jgi:hypothetical protein